MYRLFNISWFNEIFGNDSEIVFFGFLAPWGILISHCALGDFLYVCFAF